MELRHLIQNYFNRKKLFRAENNNNKFKADFPGWVISHTHKTDNNNNNNNNNNNHHHHHHHH
jgi:hypothetical protein